MRNSLLKRSLLQQRAWFHGRMFGQATMMENGARIIVASDSTNGEAKNLANQIIPLAIALREALKERIDL